MLDSRLNAALLFVCLLISTIMVAGCDRLPRTIKIGVSQPLSGELGPLGQDMLDGAKLAVKQLNDGGFKVEGKAVRFEVVPVDDRASADVGKVVAQQLVDAGVVAVIGHFNSGVSIAAAPVYAAHNIAQLATSTNPKYTELGFPTTFRLVANDSLQAKAIGSFASTQLGATRLAVIDDGTPYGAGLAQGAATELQRASKHIVLRKSVDDKTASFDETAAKLKEENVDAVVAILSDFQVLALLNSLNKIDYTNVNVVGGDMIKTTAMLKGAGLVRGLFVTSPVLEAREFPNGKKFLSEYQAAYGKDPAYGGHYTYDAVNVIAAALKRAKSADPKAITEALRSIDGFGPVTGSMKFDQKGEQRYGVISVYGIRKGAWESLVRSDSW